MNINKEQNVIMKFKIKTILTLVFIMYIIGFMLLKFLYQSHPHHEYMINLIPFNRITEISVKYIMFNIISFIPIGFFLKTLNGVKIINISLIVLLSCVTEIGQTIMKIGVFDINTIFFNLIGLLIGLYFTGAFINLKSMRKLHN